MTIESNRTLGGVAAILTLLGIFSVIASLFHYIFPNSTEVSAVCLGAGIIFGVLALVGFQLYLIAMYGSLKIIMRIEYSVTYYMELSSQ